MAALILTPPSGDSEAAFLQLDGLYARQNRNRTPKIMPAHRQSRLSLASLNSLMSKCAEAAEELEGMWASVCLLVSLLISSLQLARSFSCTFVLLPCSSALDGLSTTP